ncbi:hypothetical protein A4X09_0g1126 [Tilletia walkeri]|uniref:Uncharacterized protein n=1 Tax=Tilletia walkeri TaxID=117179 RepID=A0A8X7NDR9_9BASI|nr:hypothetical protein A4X09_0g1126 [Tilletia walkeri]
MSVKQHLDESRDPSIASFRSESQYSGSGSNPSTPGAVDDLSPRPSPSVATPITPLILRTHFISSKSRNGSEVSFGLDQDFEFEEKQFIQRPQQVKRTSLELSLAAPAFMRALSASQDYQVARGGEAIEVGKEETEIEKCADQQDHSLGPKSPAALALADFFRLREQTSTTPPQTMTNPTPATIPTLLLPSSICEAQSAPALLSSASITDGQQVKTDSDNKREAGGDGPWWMLNDRWASWEPQTSLNKAKTPRKASVGQSSLKMTPRSDEQSKEIPIKAGIKQQPVPVTGFVTPITEVIKSADQNAPSTASSPASVIIAAQRRAWISHWYPDGDLSKKPQHVQLANLRLPTLDKVDPQSQPQHAGAESPRRVIKAALELGSPFRDVGSETSGALVEEPLEMSSPAVEEVDKENRPPLPSGAKHRARTLSFGKSRASRQRTASIVAARPPPLILAKSTFAPVVGKRARANSDTSIPTSARADLDHSSSDDVFERVRLVDGEVVKDTVTVVKSILDEQALTPVWPTAPAGDVATAKAEAAAQPLRSYSSPPNTARPRAQSNADRVTFARSPVFPLRDAPPLPTRSYSTGSSVGVSAAGILSQLLHGRLQSKDAARTVITQDPLNPESVAAAGSDDMSTEPCTGKGWNSARCSLAEWEMSPQSPEMTRHSRLLSCTASADTDPDGDTRTECSTAPSTPTVPSRMLTMSPWLSSDGSYVCPTSPSSDSTGGHTGFGAGKPLPLPRVDSTAALRLRPSSGDLRQHAGYSSPSTSVSQGHATLVTDKTGMVVISMPFRELKADWEARTQLALGSGGGPSVPPSPGVSRHGSPRLGAIFGT